MGCCFSKIFCKKSGSDSLSEDEEIGEGEHHKLDDISEENVNSTPYTGRADELDTEGVDTWDDKSDEGEEPEEDKADDDDMNAEDTDNTEDGKEDGGESSQVNDSQPARMVYTYIDNGREVHLPISQDRKVYESRLIAGRGVCTSPVHQTSSWSRYLEDLEETGPKQDDPTTGASGGRYSYSTVSVPPQSQDKHPLGILPMITTRDARNRCRRPMAAKGQRTPNCFTHCDRDVTTLNAPKQFKDLLHEVPMNTVRDTRIRCCRPMVARGPRTPNCFTHSDISGSTVFGHQTRPSSYWKPISAGQRKMLENWERRVTERNTDIHGHR